MNLDSHVRANPETHPAPRASACINHLRRLDALPVQRPADPQVVDRACANAQPATLAPLQIEVDFYHIHP